MGLTVPFAPLRSPLNGDSARTISEFLIIDTGLLAPLRNEFGLPAPLRIVDTGLCGLLCSGLTARGELENAGTSEFLRDIL